MSSLITHYQNDTIIHDYTGDIRKMIANMKLLIILKVIVY